MLRFIVFVILIGLTATATARDTRHHFSIQDVLEKHAHELEGVAFYFGEQSHPHPLRKMGEYQSNKKTNAVNKTDQEACEWAFMSALLSLKNRARAEGGNAVVGIWSNYKRNRFVSDTEFECGAGAIMAGVTLKGTVVELSE